MAITGPIIIIEDDKDDQRFMTDTLEDLGVRNRIIFFDKCKDVIPYLMSTTDKPFLILSDVNMPQLSGIELRRQINENDLLRNKSIPFIFFSTTARPHHISEAYKTMVQGYFEKPNDIRNMRSILKTIIDYWTVCKHPNS